MVAGFPIVPVANGRQEFSLCWVGNEVGIFALIQSDEVRTVAVDPGVAFFMTLAEHKAGTDGGEDFLLKFSNGGRVFLFGCSFGFSSQSKSYFLFEQNWRGLRPVDLFGWDFELGAPIIEDFRGFFEELCLKEPVARLAHIFSMANLTESEESACQKSVECWVVHSPVRPVGSLNLVFGLTGMLKDYATG